MDGIMENQNGDDDRVSQSEFIIRIPNSAKQVDNVRQPANLQFLYPALTLYSGQCCFFSILLWLTPGDFTRQWETSWPPEG